jgi:hypothetical protein
MLEIKSFRDTQRKIRIHLFQIKDQITTTTNKIKIYTLKSKTGLEVRIAGLFKMN